MELNDSLRTESSSQPFCLTDTLRFPFFTLDNAWVRTNIGLSILATRYKINTRIPIIKIANRICNSIRFCVFLSVCCPRNVTKLSEDSIKLDAIDSTSFLPSDWSVVVLVIVALLVSDGDARSLFVR